MSISSYRRNVRRGVTGQNTPTCFPAALEKISPNHRLPPTVYEQYQEFCSQYDKLTQRGRMEALEEHTSLVTDIVKNLGGLCCDQLTFQFAKRRYRFRETLARLTAKDYRVMVDIDVDGVRHAVGLSPLPGDGEYRLMSTWVPHELHGAVTADQLFPLLAQPEEEDGSITPNLRLIDHPLHQYNLLALPPA